MSRFNPTDKLALPSPALHLYWRPAQQQAPGSPMCQSNTQLILAVASGTEGLELYAAATLSTKRAIYIRKGLAGRGFDEVKKRMNLLPYCCSTCLKSFFFLDERYSVRFAFACDKINHSQRGYFCFRVAIGCLQKQSQDQIHASLQHIQFKKTAKLNVKLSEFLSCPHHWGVNFALSSLAQREAKCTISPAVRHPEQKTQRERKNTWRREVLNPLLHFLSPQAPLHSYSWPCVTSKSFGKGPDNIWVPN